MWRDTLMACLPMWHFLWHGMGAGKDPRKFCVLAPLVICNEVAQADEQGNHLNGM